jgi:prepilin-type N-terminal cleavage/methylation domain-containing protein
MPQQSGFTLIELVVVLILMGLAAALVAPALFSPRHDESALRAVIGSARDAAARRGEVVYVHIDPTGQWRMQGGRNSLEGTLATGRVPPVFTAPVTLAVSPLGSCAFDLPSAAAAGAVALDPLTCDLQTR